MCGAAEHWLVFCLCVLFFLCIAAWQKMPVLPPKRRLVMARVSDCSCALERPRTKLRRAACVQYAEVAPSVVQPAASPPPSGKSVLHLKTFSATPGLPGCTSAKQREDAERARLAGIWVECARLVAPDSAFLAKLDHFWVEAVRPLFLDRAPSTLKRHLSGWRTWATFCLTMGWHAGAPTLDQLLDFLQSVADASRQDRGKNRKILHWAFCVP